MKKAINLLNFYNLLKTSKEFTKQDIIREYLQIQDMKEHEILCLSSLCQAMQDIPDVDCCLFENFYINYQIPQIGKEFDLLKFGKDKIINIELKSQQIDINKLTKQLQRNFYYLSFLQKTIYCYVFIEHDNQFYQYIPRENRSTKVGVSKIIQTLGEIDSETIHPDNLFVPTNYLVSPFSNTESFLDDQYFLTNQQEQICKEILQQIKQTKNLIFSIAGQAGTGKTLLTYHIAKELREQYKVAIVHCAKHNDGTHKLIKKDWNIEKIKYLNRALQSQVDIVVIDESQRLSSNQLQNILEMQDQKILIFSHDVRQKLNRTNEAEQVVQTIVNQANKCYELSQKIRHNKEIAYFIKKLFDPNNKSDQDSLPSSFCNISFYYADDFKKAESYINFLKKQGWEHIYLSTDLHNKDPLDHVVFSSKTSSHSAIGQEWDNVVISITCDFYYTENGKLSYKAKSYYNPLETLFQALTRARKKLCIVIINNPDIFKKCIEITTKN